jgi:ribosomal protein S18 acetylase RimI-like enzyme
MVAKEKEAGRIVTVRPIRESDRSLVEKLLFRRWGPPGIVTRGKMHRVQSYAGFVAWSDRKIVGLVTFRLHGRRCEITTLDALRKGRGIGSRLLAVVERHARRSGCREAWLITTNDNLRALRFYQRRGWAIRRVYPGAISASRKLKPSIPVIGSHGIPLRDEIELFKRFDRTGRGR